jgi:hypothetical protein
MTSSLPAFPHRPQILINARFLFVQGNCKSFPWLTGSPVGFGSRLRVCKLTEKNAAEFLLNANWARTEGKLPDPLGYWDRVWESLILEWGGGPGMDLVFLPPKKDSIAGRCRESQMSPGPGGKRSFLWGFLVTFYRGTCARHTRDDVTEPPTRDVTSVKGREFLPLPLRFPSSRRKPTQPRRRQTTLFLQFRSRFLVMDPAEDRQIQTTGRPESVCMLTPRDPAPQVTCHLLGHHDPYGLIVRHQTCIPGLIMRWR